MDKHLQEESERLKKSWMQHDSSMLRDYLVSHVEDPRLNLQSILTRHFLIQGLFGARFPLLKAAEIHFSATVNWLEQFFKSYPSAEDAQALLHGLEHQADNADGIDIPQFLLNTYASLPVFIEEVNIPNYIQKALQHHPDAPPQPIGRAEGAVKATELIKGTFQSLWHSRLARLHPPPLSVLEPACGSANDYRFLRTCGLARFLNYTGIDICEKNIGNAREIFPDVNFKTANIFQLDAPGKCFDCCFVHDLFEHLSPQGIEAAAAEICRVTKSALCLHFFNMDEIDEHEINPVEDYHWNRLSMERMRELLQGLGAANVQVIHIGTFLEAAVPSAQTHNENAYTFLVQMGT
jgi:SAM-dependent methyltransferase